MPDDHSTEPMQPMVRGTIAATAMKFNIACIVISNVTRFYDTKMKGETSFISHSRK
jgi:hypothetical protein